MNYSLHEYLHPKFLRLIYPDLKCKISERANAVMYYSEQRNQMIYIKELIKARSISIRAFDGKGLIRDKMKNDAKRKMQKLFGKKRGINRYNDAYKCFIFISANITPKIYRYLNKLNYALKHNKTNIMYLIFDTEKYEYRTIAGAICNMLMKQYKKLHEISIKTIKQKDMIPFGKLQMTLQDLEYIINKLHSKYYELLPKEILTKKLEEDVGRYEFNIIVHGTPMSEEIEFKREKVEWGKEPYQPNIEVT
jgi:hypothetical protein